MLVNFALQFELLVLHIILRAAIIGQYTDLLLQLNWYSELGEYFYKYYIYFS